jgi:hypothetical protein
MVTLGKASNAAFEETLDPSDWRDVQALSHQIIDDAVGYLRDVRDRPVWRDVPAASSIIGGGEGASPWLHLTAEIMRTLLPEMERMGVARAAEVGVETLYERLRREIGSGGGVIIGRSEIGAWSRV